MTHATSAFPMTRLAFRGIERVEQGRTGAARSDLQQAVSCDSPTAVAWARYGLGLLEERSGRYDEARRQYRRGIGSEHPAAGPWSSLGLGLLERDHGDRSAARAPLERAACSDDAEAAPRAAIALAVLAEWDGDLAGARQLYRTAHRSGDGESVVAARIALARLDGDRPLPDGVRPGELDAPVPAGTTSPARRSTRDGRPGVLVGVLLGVAAALLLCLGIGVGIALALAALATMGFWWTALSTAIGMATYTLLYVITRFGGPFSPASAAICFGAVVTTVYHLNAVHAHHPAWTAILVGVVLGALIVGHGLRGNPDPSPWSAIAAKH